MEAGTVQHAALDAHAALQGAATTLPLDHVLSAAPCGNELIFVGMPKGDQHAHVFGLDAQARVRWNEPIPNHGLGVASPRIGCSAAKAQLIWTAVSKSATVFTANVSARPLRPTALLPKFGYTSNVAVVGSGGALFVALSRGLDQRGLRLYRVEGQRVVSEQELVAASDNVMSVGLHALPNALLATWVRNGKIEIQKLGLDGKKLGPAHVVKVDASGGATVDSVEAWVTGSGYAVLSFTTDALDGFVAVEQRGRRPPRTEPAHTFQRYAGLCAIDRDVVGPFVGLGMVLFGGWLGGNWLAVEAPNNRRQVTVYRPTEEPAPAAHQAP